jgi:hypothetical protein
LAALRRTQSSVRPATGKYERNSNPQPGIAH